MNVHEIEKNIITAKALNDWEYINKIHEDLSTKLFKLDKWINKFLDIFSEKMDYMESNDPVQKLYRIKYKEYSDISKLLKILNHYTEMKHV